MMRLAILAGFLALAAAGSNRTVVVTGATGRSGSLVYLQLQQAGANVRGLVRNATKANEYLGCTKCDESEGIFVGDVTDPQSMGPAMAGADALVITVGGVSDAKDVYFDGVANQVAAFLGSPGPAPQQRHVSLISMFGTTLPPTLWNRILSRIWGGYDVGFYSLQGEVLVMSAGVPFTIVKACGLDEHPGGQKKVLVGHDDKDPWTPLISRKNTIARADVARVLTAAVLNPELSAYLRMDVCSVDGAGPPQASGVEVLKEGMQPWDPRKSQQAHVLI